MERGKAVRGLLLPSEQPSVPGAEYIHDDVLEPESLSPLFQHQNDEKLVVIHTYYLSAYSTAPVPICTSSFAVCSGCSMPPRIHVPMAPPIPETR